MGIATYPDHADTAEDILKYAKQDITIVNGERIRQVLSLKKHIKDNKYA